MLISFFGGVDLDNIKNFRDFCRFLSILILGNILYALTLVLFLLPGNLMSGGATGLSLAVNHYFQIPISLFLLVFNVAMLLLGWAFLGRTFALSTLGSTFLGPFFLEVFTRLWGDVTLTSDPLLYTIFSGLGVGLSLGLIIRTGASTGGMDIPPLLLHKRFKIPVSVSLYVFDCCILLLQTLFHPAEDVLYGILLVMLYSLVLDKVLILGKTSTEVRVVSPHSEEIRKAILEKMDRGITMLEAETGYLGMKTQIVMTVVSKRELPMIERLIHSIDPECFMVVSRVSEVSGRGFSLEKLYK